MQSAVEFRHLRLDGYSNINEIAAVRDRLHACETLFGDLSAPVMLLGQDAAHFSKFADLVKAEGPDGYRHGKEVSTNNALIYCFETYLTERGCRPEAIPNRQCGLFYANAIWLLKNGKGMGAQVSRPLEALKVCQPVLQATILGLPNLRVVIPLGSVAYQALRLEDPSLRQDWRSVVAERTIQTSELFGKKLLIAPIRHPSRRSGGRDLSGLREHVEDILGRAGLLECRGPTDH